MTIKVEIYKLVALNDWMSHVGGIAHTVKQLYLTFAVRFSVDVTSLLQTHGSKVQGRW